MRSRLGAAAVARSTHSAREAASASSFVSIPLGLDTDTFPVAVAVRYLDRKENIAYAVVYALFATLLTLRVLLCRKPLAFHRRVAYALFPLACTFRIAQFILNAVGAHASGDGHTPDWRAVFANDLLSTFGWAIWLCAVFALGYSWSGRIPCVYCMVQFSDEPHWIKGVAVYLIPFLLTTLTIVATVLRLVAVLHPWSKGYHLMDPALFERATFVARASVASALAFSCCFVIVIPYTAWQRRRSRILARVSGVMHKEIGALVQSRTLNKMHGFEPDAVIALVSIGVCTIVEAIYRVMLVDTTRELRVSSSWFRGQLAMDLLEVFPEWIVLVLIFLVDFQAMSNGTVELRWFWEGAGPRGRRLDGDAEDENPTLLSEASFWTSHPRIAAPQNSPLRNSPLSTEYWSSVELPFAGPAPPPISLNDLSTSYVGDDPKFDGLEHPPYEQPRAVPVRPTTEN